MSRVPTGTWTPSMAWRRAAIRCARATPRVRRPTRARSFVPPACSMISWAIRVSARSMPGSSRTCAFSRRLIGGGPRAPGLARGPRLGPDEAGPTPRLEAVLPRRPAVDDPGRPPGEHVEQVRHVRLRPHVGAHREEKREEEGIRVADGREGILDVVGG